MGSSGMDAGDVALGHWWWTSDPVWPWSLPYVGVPVFALLLLLVAGLTIATYLRTRMSIWRLALLLLLRLAALALFAGLCLRPTLAWQDEAVLPSRLLVVVDASRSMNVRDELNNQSRWERVRSLWRNARVQAALERLKEKHHLEVVAYQGAEDLAPLNLDGPAEGRRTEIGAWLQALYQRHNRDRELRGLVLFSDGADNGQRFSALEEAQRWRARGCPVYTFALGSAATSSQVRDIAFVPDHLQVIPDPVYVKGRLTVKALVDAPGFANSRVRLHLLINGQEAAPPRDCLLLKPAENVVEMSCDAPDQAGEVKVTLHLEPLPGEANTDNNTVSTFASITKEGLSILWLEGRKRAFEAVFAIRHALGRDPRFRVHYAELLPGQAPIREEDPLQLRKQHYDVIVLGDLPAERLASYAAGIFGQLRELVAKRKTGLLFLGGVQALGNGGWQQVPEIRELLPVSLGAAGQVEEPVRFRPTPAAFQDYLLGFPGKLEEQLQPWLTIVDRLDGLTPLGEVREGATVYATDEARRPLLVGRTFGSGRVLVFAADSTWKSWRRRPEALKVYERFWQQVLLWLAHQEKASGKVWIEPDRRRWPAGPVSSLGFTIRMRGKSGREDDIGRLQMTARLVDPQGKEKEVPVIFEGGRYRGVYNGPLEAGEYLLRVSAQGTESDGTLLKEDAEARVIVYAEDIETSKVAAAPEFLARLATAAGGRSYSATESELLSFLQQLWRQPVARLQSRPQFWPEWRREPVSVALPDQWSALWQSATLPVFLLFCSLICVEWALRRHWGLV
jgi:hypothetical protein